VVPIALGSPPPELKVQFEGGCPVKASLDVLGRRWALLILRNIGLYRTQRFNEMLRITPGMTRRILAMRLKELERANFIRPVERGPNYTKWGLTEKGEDALPILMALVQFGAKWYAEEVFPDRRPRSLIEVFDRSYIERVFKGFTGELTPPIRARKFGKRVPRNSAPGALVAATSS
jgi:DNA-binding HxlR family transcriptional regulator